MAQLIQMRQRMQAIETIKKVTHAMRLISMSTHSRVRIQERHARAYAHKLAEIVPLVTSTEHNKVHPLLQKTSEQNNILVILVGSQKGLCGTFNAQLFAAFQQYCTKHPNTSMDVIVVGKKMCNYFERKPVKNASLAARYEVLSPARLNYITHRLAHEVMQRATSFDAITLLSSRSRTFFMQQQQETVLKPFALPTELTNGAPTSYLQEHDQVELISALLDRLLHSTIRDCLLGSLLAEHAARFVAMDSSTRNATSMLEEMRIRYNKLRQAKITKELTELNSSFSASF